MVLWIRSILAVVAALVSAFVVVAVGQGVGHATFPVPANVDLSSHEAIRVAMNQGEIRSGGCPGFCRGGLGDRSSGRRVGCDTDGDSSETLPRDHFWNPLPGRNDHHPSPPAPSALDVGHRNRRDSSRSLPWRPAGLAPGCGAGAAGCRQAHLNGTCRSRRDGSSSRHRAILEFRSAPRRARRRAPAIGVVALF